MSKPHTNTGDTDGALARALTALLADEKDERARAWLERLIRGDAKPVKRSKRPRKTAG
jgi:hypothetical protein